MKQAKLKDDSKKGQFEVKIKELQKTIFDLEAVIEDLKLQLESQNENSKV